MNRRANSNSRKQNPAPGAASTSYRPARADRRQATPAPFSVARELRRIYLWFALAVIVLLIVLSIHGATIGQKDAAEMFNSSPMAVLWVFLLIGLIVSPFAFPNLRAVGPLATHVGPGLVLIGALWGSAAMHEFRVQHMGHKGVWKGRMALREGTPTDTVWARGAAEPDRLPFSLNLNRFSMDYYGKPPGQWWLYLATTFQMPGGPPEGVRQEFNLEWSPPPNSPTIDLPFGVKADVRGYLPHARREPVLLIRPPGGSPATMPAEPGAEITLDRQKVTLKVVRVFANYANSTSRPEDAEDAPGPPRQPALHVMISGPDRQPEVQTVLADFAPAGEFGMSYAMTVVPDAASLYPAMELYAQPPHGGRGKTVRIVPPPRQGDSVCQAWPAGLSLGRSQFDFALVRPGSVMDIRSFNADVAIIDGEREAGTALIRVNHPLHYGGYHFYQSSYAQMRDDMTYLDVVSDAGLGWVYAGFFVTMIGILWKFWVLPAYRRLRR